tara:strand:+ start:333 stop:776 length:444 start_codon:yes stop_codon:yes gene_type:complete
MKISKEGIALIKKFEGIELQAYQDSVGVWTIGYGHTKGVKEGDNISLKQAEAMLEEELEEYEGYINDMVKVRLEQNQFDALVAWVYNLGPTNLAQSTLLKVLNKAIYEEVPYEIRRWNKAGGQVLNGLVRRRDAEALLFKGEPWENV